MMRRKRGRASSQCDDRHQGQQREHTERCAEARMIDEKTCQKRPAEAGNRVPQRQQAEILIAMSRATLDLGMAGRLREMASELQARAAEQEDTRAAEQEDKRGSNDNELANVRPPFRMGS